MKETNWEELRDRFFKECTTDGEDFDSVIQDHYRNSPYDLFDWFKNQLEDSKEAGIEQGEDNRLNELIKKHLHFHGKTDDKSWLQASIKHYLENGKPSGSLYSAIKTIAEEHAFTEKHLFQIKKKMQENRNLLNSNNNTKEQQKKLITEIMQEDEKDGLYNNPDIDLKK